MYSLACINLSSEAHLADALGSSQYPVLKVPGGLVPSPAPRCGARKNYTSIPHSVSRKILRNFPTRCGGADALRPHAPRSRPASRAFAAGVSHYTSPRRFVKGVIRKNFQRAPNAACRRIRTIGYLREKRAWTYPRTPPCLPIYSYTSVR